MSEMLRASIVRVRRDSDQQVVGVGFLLDVGRKTILTCAHVVNAAIGDTKNQVKPRSLITLDFPFIDTEQRFGARVMHFFPKQHDNTDDIAVLELLDALPQGAKVAQIVIADTYSSHEFGVYGFPQGFEEEGQYVEGKLQERLVNKRIQAVGTSNLGHFVEEGFSGSPVYDKELQAVVGMMMSIANEREKRVAYICPPDVMAGLYPDLPYRKIEHSAKVPASTSTPSGKWLQRVDIFISSPSDVSEEREAILRVIERLNRLSYIRSRYVLNPLLYEKEVPPEAGDHAQMILDRYLAVEDSYLLICLMWNRMGTPFTHPQTGEEFQSETEYEFTVGYRANSKNTKPHLLVYRKTTEQDSVDKSEKGKVDTFFKRFEEDKAIFKGLYKKFSSLSEFENMLFEHIDHILHINPPDANRMNPQIESHIPPDFVEEARRLDAAMPSECQVGTHTEVRVMICRMSSSGLAQLLPDYTIGGELIYKSDVRKGQLSVTFPVNPKTQRLEQILVEIEISASEFEIGVPFQSIMLSPRINSGLLVFRLWPTKVQRISSVHVVAKCENPNAGIIVLGSVSLRTEIKPSSSRISNLLWEVVSLPFSLIGDIRKSRLQLLARKLHYNLQEFSEISEDEEKELIKKATVLLKSQSSELMMSEAIDTLDTNVHEIKEFAELIQVMLPKDDMKLNEIVSSTVHDANIAHSLVALSRKVRAEMTFSESMQQINNVWKTYLQDIGHITEVDPYSLPFIQQLEYIKSNEIELRYGLLELLSNVENGEFEKALGNLNQIESLYAQHPILDRFYWKTKEKGYMVLVRSLKDLRQFIQVRLDEIYQILDWAEPFGVPQSDQYYEPSLIETDWQLVQELVNHRLSVGEFQDALEKVRLFQLQVIDAAERASVPPIHLTEVLSSRAQRLLKWVKEHVYDKSHQILHEINITIYKIRESSYEWTITAEQIDQLLIKLDAQKKVLGSIWGLFGLRHRRQYITHLKSEAEALIETLQHLCPSHPDLSTYERRLAGI